MSTKSIRTRGALFAAAAILATLTFSVAQADPLDIKNQPLFISDAVAPLNMLVVGRDHKLYYEAYNDASDLNGDGIIDRDFKPALTYYGYFDSGKCYKYSTNMFTPDSVAGAANTCSSAWSGNWLNYVTTARIDALRKVLYGGFRRVDSESQTVLERSHIPHDAHSWVKEYRGTAEDGYDISKYTPLSLPASGKTHLFANVTLMLSSDWKGNAPTDAANPPLLRVAENVTGPNNRAWHWASTESPDAGACYGRDGGNDGRCAGASADAGSGAQMSANTSSFKDLNVRVEVCKDGLLEDNCEKYPKGNYKPVGLLQDYGEKDTMKFGLTSGSYQKSKSGGVVRRGINDLKAEINITTDGTFKDFNGIISTLNKLRAAGYTNYRDLSYYGVAGRGAGVQYRATLPSGSGLVTTRPFNEPEFGGMWGNPVGEMMYETLRYFSGAKTPTSGFNYSSGYDVDLGLPKVDTWTNPYGKSASGNPSCAKPFMTVISDINPSYDSDQLPGSSFTGSGDAAQPTDKIGSLDVSKEAQAIWDTEFGGEKSVFIGQVGSAYDGAPSPKKATSFGNIRGLAPEEPTKRGSYYAASVAKYGHETDINPVTGVQSVQTFAVALASPLPRIEVPVGGSKVTIVPFAKSVSGNSIDATEGQFQPTNQIVDFYIESMASDGTSGSFLINFEDVESGNDHDMDALARYSYSVVGGQVKVTVDRLYEQGGITHHMGYVVSGSSANGIYLVTQDDETNVPYFLDTPPGKNPDDCRSTLCKPRTTGTRGLPWSDTRYFTPDSGTSAMLLRDPLWYAAKWGGFKDSNGNGVPDVESEWNADSDAKDPAHNPDNYFLVTNALTLKAQLTSAFDTILSRTAASSSASVNSGTINEATRIYQAQFTTGDWSGDIVAYPVFGGDDPATTDVVEQAGEIGKPVWHANAKVPAADKRNIFTVNTDGTAVSFEWDKLDSARQKELQPEDTSGKDRLAYLRGVRTLEQPDGAFRARNKDTVLGDFIDSSPVFVGDPREPFDDTIDSAAAYSEFKADKTGRQKAIYAGANDGMLHAFDADTGIEMWSFIPSPVFANLQELSKPNYLHHYYVDGPINVFDAVVGTSWKSVLVGGLNNGGQGIYALDVTNPKAASAADAAGYLMWEYTDADDADLGYTYSKPSIAKMPDGKWYAIFGNGYNNTVPDTHTSTTGDAVLYLVQLDNKSNVIKLDTKAGYKSDPLSLDRPNGLSSPAVVDLDGDGVVDMVYAGDLYGNVWKFKFAGTDKSAWGIPYTTGTNAPAPLFIATDSAGNRQPITTRPQVGLGRRGEGTTVLVGTGKFLESSDRVVADIGTQTFYGIWDRNLKVDKLTDGAVAKVSRSDLQEQSVLTEVTPPGGTELVRVTSQNAIGSKLGWYMDLPAAGEIQVTNSALRNRRVIFTTQIPSDDPCAGGGTSWLMELDYLTGARLEDSAFDLNNDGKFDAADLIKVVINGKEYVITASGVKSTNGIWSQPAFLTSGADEFLFMSTSNTNDGTGSGCNESTLVCRRNGVPPTTYGRQSWRQVK